MIKINSVSKSFGDFTAIEDINFEVENYSIYGLVGYNGAGKTTLAYSSLQRDLSRWITKMCMITG